MKDSGVTGALVVTTPQEMGISVNYKLIQALQDVRKEINFCRKVKLPVLGVIENMAVFNCGHCKKDSFIFDANSGGAKQMCLDMDVPLLGSIPIDPLIAQCCDNGISYIDEYPTTPAANVYLGLISDLKKRLA